ncbi:hypothetical protein NP233_g12103 [Leucocoprinus birnbaumii]|uniref:Uncharacterized protein n=1 Tax=Leucocoprinus birnbaumii TaxID=56174 RepID=A0AAD5YJR7_9AGAR|nr:hypothetical protein NP233_g12103 [Leucocoprinus birnbaumii]
MNYAPNHAQVDNRVINMSGSHTQNPMVSENIARLNSLPPSWESSSHTRRDSEPVGYGSPAMQSYGPSMYSPHGPHPAAPIQAPYDPIPPRIMSYPPPLGYGHNGYANQWPPVGFGYEQVHQPFVQSTPVSPVSPSTPGMPTNFYNSPPASPISPTAPSWHPIYAQHQSPEIGMLSVPATAYPAAGCPSVSATPSVAESTVVASSYGQHSEELAGSDATPEMKKTRKLKTWAKIVHWFLWKRR